MQMQKKKKKEASARVKSSSSECLNKKKYGKSNKIQFKNMFCVYS